MFIYYSFQDFIVRIPGRGDVDNYLALILFFATLHEEDDILKKYIKVSTEKDIALALTQLAIGGNKDAINTFIRNGANTTSQDPHGYTPLLAALKEIQRSENLNLYGCTNHDRKPYMCYKIRNVLNVCELLLEHGANLNDYKLSNYSSSVVDYSAIEIMACLFNLWTAGDYSYLDNRPDGTNESFKDKLVHLMSRNYYKLSNKGKDLIKEERN